MDWGLSQDIMKAKASASDDLARAVHLKAEFGNRKAAQITPLMVDNFRVKMKKTISESTDKPYSGATINKMVSLARRVYYLGMDAGIVKSNPFARRGTFKEEPKGRYIPDEEFWMIYKHLPDYLKPVVLVAYLTGMRRGEILELEWDRVNLSEGHVDLTPDDTKTDEPRRIYFNSIKELKDVFIEADRKKKAGQKLVFTKEDGSPVPKWYIRDLLIDACNKVNVGPYRLHDLRHTFNTNMRKAGVDQVVIMKITGHKTNKMFLRYSHIDKEQGERAMEKLNGLLSSKNGKARLVGSE
jgi:integrase